MNIVFADAYYFVGLLNKADQHRAKIIAAVDRNYDLVTTEWILTELADAFCLSGRRRHIARFIERLVKDPKISIIASNADLFRRGLLLYDARPDKQWPSPRASPSSSCRTKD